VSGHYLENTVIDINEFAQLAIRMHMQVMSRTRRRVARVRARTANLCFSDL
jgi:hypothetical protein